MYCKKRRTSKKEVKEMAEISQRYGIRKPWRTTAIGKPERKKAEFEGRRSENS
jgi:hypothetical protein